MSTILIVEDNDNSRKLVRDMLRQGLPYARSRDGEDGVRLAREHRPDLMLMDIQLPGINGMTALRGSARSRVRARSR